ncbi:MAG: addiction module protein, partial [Candidatus Hydrogenedentes bacterium]|nr:addiction module protein [Candidatus Hydrogenedentota bacterium]
MDSHFDEVASQALKLPVRDRVRLAQPLTSIIEHDVEDSAGFEALWIAVAQRRLDEMREGRV